MSNPLLITPSPKVSRSRTADYTIQGFLYQFNKTLLSILEAPADAEITVEGIVEDIEVASSAGQIAIQCKYHEAQESFVPSSVFKPLLQMMQHFHAHQGSQIKYILFAYFPGVTAGSAPLIGNAEIQAALESQNKDLKPLIDVLKGNVDVDAFLGSFSLEPGPQYQVLVDDVCTALKRSGIHPGDIDALAYPNAVQIIANLSIKHDVAERKITKSGLLEELQCIRTTAISRWTLALRTRKQVLEARRKQLKTNLGKNTRKRCLVVTPEGLEDFDSGIVMFLNDYLEKYHFKPAHIHTPLVCLATRDEDLRDIQLRLHRRGVICEDGYVGGVFDENWLFRQPMVTTSGGRVLRREFAVRLVKFDAGTKALLNDHKCDDLFLLGTDDLEGIVTQDVNVEVLAANNLKEVSYLMGVSDVYD